MNLCEPKTMDELKDCEAKSVRLFDVRAPAIIVDAKTGVLYQAQVGGVGCYQRFQEGFLIPVVCDSTSWVFSPEWWYDNFSPDLWGKTDAGIRRRLKAFVKRVYTEIERAFKKGVLGEVKNLKVVRSGTGMLGWDDGYGSGNQYGNHEAWVKVTFKLDGKPHKGILTW